MQLLLWFSRKRVNSGFGPHRVKALKKQQRVKIHPKRGKIIDRSGKTNHSKFKVRSSEFFLKLLNKNVA